MITRRELLKRGVLGGAVLAAPAAVGLAPTALLAPAAAAKAAPRPFLRKWVDACPTPGGSWPVIDLITTPSTTLEAKEFTVAIHADLPPTRVWGYEPGGAAATGRSTYLGPTLVARRGVPVEVTFRNGLPVEPLFPTDPELVPEGAVDGRINTHLHGGRVRAGEDGNPFDAYSGGKPEVVPGGQQVQRYPNQQGGALLWYHDHALGITRTNVYAGMAGGYLLTEPPGSPYAAGNVPTAFDLSGVDDPYAPGGKIPLHIPLVIQDKDLDGAGQLVYPYPWAPEFFGENCLVNGKAFPHLDVQPRVYRFTFLNGSQSRFYHLRFNKRVAVTQIGVELGLLDAAVPLRSILLAPAERVDVLVDFSGLATGTKVVLGDVGLPAGVVSPTRPLGDCMQFRVVGPRPALDPFAGPPVLPGWTVDSPTRRPVEEPVTTSTVTLEEVLGRGGKPLRAVVNGSTFMARDGGGMMTGPDEPFTTEIVDNGSTVEWLYLNLTADSHPFHTHLAHFEVMGRTPFDAVAYAEALEEEREELEDGDRLDPADYPDVEPFLLGDEVPAPASEKGPKDTVIANPGEVTRIRLRFDLPAGTAGAEHRYVYHCHILEHEENEMMRPLVVRGEG